MNNTKSEKYNLEPEVIEKKIPGRQSIQNEI